MQLAKITTTALYAHSTNPGAGRVPRVVRVLDTHTYTRTTTREPGGPLCAPPNADGPVQPVVAHHPFAALLCVSGDTLAAADAAAADPQTLIHARTTTEDECAAWMRAHHPGARIVLAQARELAPYRAPDALAVRRCERAVRDRERAVEDARRRLADAQADLANARVDAERARALAGEVDRH